MELQSILNKLSQIQATISVAKNQKNSFGNYNYRSCEDILQALQPYCEKLGVVILLTDEIKELMNGWVFVEATAKIIDCETQEEISVKAQAGIQERKGMDLSQTFGASSSYARKYALNGLLKLDDNKDADTDAFTKKIKEIEKQEKAENKPPKVETKENKAEDKKQEYDFKKDIEKALKNDKQVVSDDDLPFTDISEEVDKFAQATNNLFKANEEREIDVLERLRDLIASKLYELGNKDLTQAYGYYAKSYKKATFEDLSENELQEIVKRLDAKLIARKEAQ